MGDSTNNRDITADDNLRSFIEFKTITEEADGIFYEKDCKPGEKNVELKPES